MIRRPAIYLAAAVGLAAIVLPVVAAIYLAGRQSNDHELARAAALAESIVRHSDEVSEQIHAAIASLKAAQYADPCGPEAIARMREIDLGSTRLQAVGYVRGDRLMCSSLGSHGAGIDIGSAGYLNDRGLFIRPAVALPFAPGMLFTFSTDRSSGYAAIVHRDRTLDVTETRADVAMGLISRSSGEIIARRGLYKPEWVDRNSAAFDSGRFDGRHIIATARSQEYDYIAYAAVPAGYLQAGMRRAALVLLPIGLAAGIVLALAVYYLTRQQMSLPALLRGGLRRDEFFLLYQPLVDLQTGKWHGAEALIRWHRVDGKMIRPDLFIAAAEEGGLIRQVTKKVMDLIVRDTAALLRRHPQFHIGINLASDDLQNESIVGELRDMLKKAGIGPGSIMVEATERGFLQAEHVSRIISEIRAMGICVAIDDFGTGYSSLSYLTTFELDYLKIDKSFVDTIGTEAATSQVILHIIEMAKSLDLKIIAEGVETEAQAQYLREQGVQYAQGFLFGKPMPIGELASRLERPVVPRPPSRS